MPQQLSPAFPEVMGWVCWMFFSGYGLTLPLPRHPPGPPATAVVAVTPPSPSSIPTTGLVVDKVLF